MSLSSLRLLQLCSANLPTGAYAFSHGLETATEEGWIGNFEQTKGWLTIQIEYAIAGGDLPILRRAMAAFQDDDLDRVQYWNRLVLALRETNELRLTDSATGMALMRVLKNLNGLDVECFLYGEREVSFVTAFAFAAHHWKIDLDEACLGYVWAWLENQVAAATKLVPLGQTQSQQLLEQLQQNLMTAIDRSKNIEDDDIGESLPMLAVASCWHEHQYSRLFRS